ncbi:FAD dependent oxidoreductase [Pisolithus marmoratus]|nr:FAD dependent oxidoreductase [Pisolithus marmoratus]
MGNAISLLRVVLADFMETLRGYQVLKDNMERPPGLPVDGPSRSFWMYPPSPIAKHCSQVPDYADFVVIGSGITGTSVARRLLEGCRAAGWDGARILMLEARDACSGATGRNGGHISPPLYHDWAALQKQYGDVTAQKLIKFRLAHLQELRKVAEEEGILDISQWRAVDLVDVYYDSRSFDKAKDKLSKYQQDLPFEASHHRVYEAAEVKETFHLADDVAGCIVSGAGAIHPYRFVTGILSNLLARYPDNFLLCTNTPCVSISGPSTSTRYYTVTTPQGKTYAPHVIHATNGWCAHLLKSMRAKIVPIRANMTAQRPGRSLPPTTVPHSYVFYPPSGGFDYLTQLPNGDRELMFGAAFTQSAGYDEVGNTDDRVYNKCVGARLGGVLPRYFGEKNWGAEAQPTGDDDHSETEWNQGRTKAIWSGILGASVDFMPWVGRLPKTVSCRPEPPVQSSPQIPGVRAGKDEVFFGAAPGEWIAAGFTGEGMVHAWLSGKALAGMILGTEKEDRLSEWFPDALRMSHSRWRKAKLEPPE